MSEINDSDSCVRIPAGSAGTYIWLPREAMDAWRTVSGLPERLIVSGDPNAGVFALEPVSEATGSVASEDTRKLSPMGAKGKICCAAVVAAVKAAAGDQDFPLHCPYELTDDDPEVLIFGAP
jgi:hypothetical protein